MPIYNVVIQTLAAIAGLGITGAAFAAAGYWLFKTFAKSWLESRFQKDLEEFRATNMREVERLKADLGRYADRATKFHAREYEVLPEAWGLMNKAFGACHYATSAFQEITNPDLMSSAQLEAWLESIDLKDFQKEEIRNSTKKFDKYADIYTLKQIHVAEISAEDFQNYVVLQGVFIEEQLAEKMIEAAATMRKALISRRMAELTKNSHAPSQTDFWTQAFETLEPVKEAVQEVKEAIRTRLSDIRPPTKSLQ